MSDEEEYEYEYDDDAMEEDQLDYTDEEEAADDSAVALGTCWNWAPFSFAGNVFSVSNDSNVIFLFC